MRPWSPDDLLEASAAVAAAVDERPAAFDPDFVEDFPRDGLAGFLNRLELHEREALYQLVREELHEKIHAELAADYARRIEEGRTVAAALARRLEEKFDEELTSVAHHALDLSIAMAEQIVRHTVDLDRDALLKALETVVFRVKRGTRFTVVVHPDDADYLRERPQDLERLNITNVEIDRRIERGGCLVDADGQEFDYTLAGRLDRLEEVVREVMLDADGAAEEPS